MEIGMGTSRSKTHHLNIQMLPPNNIMHYGFWYLRTTLLAAVSWGVIHGREQERDTEGETLSTQTKPLSASHRKMACDNCTD